MEPLSEEDLVKGIILGRLRLRVLKDLCKTYPCLQDRIIPSTENVVEELENEYWTQFGN